MYYIQYIICRFFIFILKLFPEKIRFSFGNFLGWLTYKLIKKRREIALLNLRMAFPEKTEEERIQIAKKSFKIMIKAFLCSLWFENYFKNKKNYKIINSEITDELYKRNKGIISATMHLGNMEASTIAVAKYEVLTVAKTQRNPYINKYMKKNREQVINMEVIEKDAFTSKKLIKRLGEKKIIALFSDHRDKGEIIKFFGTDAKAPTGATSLALKYDIPLNLVYNIFNDDNTITIFVSEEIKLDRTNNFKEDVHNATQKLISIMEDVIRKHPEQWMWFHDRWNLHSQFKKQKNKII